MHYWIKYYGWADGTTQKYNIAFNILFEKVHLNILPQSPKIWGEALNLNYKLILNNTLKIKLIDRRILHVEKYPIACS